MHTSYKEEFFYREGGQTFEKVVPGVIEMSPPTPTIL